MSFEEFLSQLSDILETPAADLRPDSKLADQAGWNSMALVSFIAFVDESLGKTLSPRVIGPCETIADLARVAGVNP
jgi:acyl carrier protein